MLSSDESAALNQTTGPHATALKETLLKFLLRLTRNHNLAKLQPSIFALGPHLNTPQVHDSRPT